MSILKEKCVVWYQKPEEGIQPVWGGSQTNDEILEEIMPKLSKVSRRQPNVELYGKAGIGCKSTDVIKVKVTSPNVWYDSEKRMFPEEKRFPKWGKG